MAETLPHAEPGVGPDTAPGAATSRWQKVVGVLGLIVVLWVGNDTYQVIDGNFGGGPPAANQGTDGGGGHRPGPPVGGH